MDNLNGEFNKFIEILYLSDEKQLKYFQNNKNNYSFVYRLISFDKLHEIYNFIKKDFKPLLHYFFNDYNISLKKSLLVWCLINQYKDENLSNLEYSHTQNIYHTYKQMFNIIQNIDDFDKAKKMLQKYKVGTDDEKLIEELFDKNIVEKYVTNKTQYNFYYLYNLDFVYYNKIYYKFILNILKIYEKNKKFSKQKLLEILIDENLNTTFFDSTNNDKKESDSESDDDDNDDKKEKESDDNVEKIIIKSKEINCKMNRKLHKCVYPKLFSKNQNGKYMWWQIYVENNKIYTSKGFVGSENITNYKPSVISGKNIGRKNETSPHEQALFEAQTIWKKKIDAGYSTSKDDTKSKKSSRDVLVKYLPMLANKYIPDKTKLNKNGVYVSEKLDGVRALTGYNTQTKKIEMWTRTGRDINHFENIRNNIIKILNELNDNSLVFDGELYSHEIEFNKISGIVRRKTTKSEDEKKIHYYIFDIVDIDKTYKERLKILERINEIIKELNIKNIRIVLSTLVYKPKQILEYHNKFVKNGYEGIMIRNPDSKYLLKNRSAGLLKYKEFEDAEFEIVDVVCGQGNEDKCAIFVCKNNDDCRTFNVRPRGSFEKRKEQYKNRKKLIGKKLTVRWQPSQNNDNDNLPRFPVGIDIRDYE